MIRMRLLLLASLLLAVPSFAQSTTGRRGGRAAVARVIRFDALPRVAEPPSQTPIGIEEGEVPIGEQAMNELKRRPAPDARLLPRVTLDRRATRAGLEPMAPVTGVTFEGITQGRYIPGEPTVAAGPLNIFSTGNTSVTVTDRDGSNRVEIPSSIFFGVPAEENNTNDPVCWFDPHYGRFLVLVFTHGSTWSKFYLAVSQTADARGTWYVYTFDQMVDGTTPTTNWSDFEGLGVSADKIAMTSQQYSQLNQYRYQKIRILDRALAYAGGPVPYVDLVNFAPPPGGTVSNLFATKAGRNLTAGDSTIHVFTVRYDGGSDVAYRTITGPPTAPVLSAGSRVTVSSYTPPPNAVQKGTTTLVNTGDCRTPEFFVRDGLLTIAWHTGVRIQGTDYSGLRLFRMRTADQAVVTDETYAAAGSFYYYPAAAADSVGTVFVGFDASSATEYPSAYATGKRRGEPALQPSAVLHAGHNFTLQERWGDYTGIELDAFATGPAGSSAWYAGQYAYGNSVFRTQINRLTYTYGQIAGTLRVDCDGDSATSGDRSALAGVSVTLRQGGNPVATTVTDAAGAWSFGWLETGTYDLQAVAPGGGAAVDAMPGSGGNAQLRTGPGAIQVDLTDAQISSGNAFVIAVSKPPPAIASIEPVSRTAGDSAFVLTVTGSDYTECSVVRIDGADRPTTFVSTGELTALIPSSDVATSGSRAVTVFTPAPGGGPSNVMTLTVSGGATGVGTALPLAFALAPVEPNPTTGSARIRYALPRAAHVRLSVMDVQGREVARLEDGERPAGEHAVTWNARGSGRSAAAGFYLVRIEADGRTLVRRVTLSP
jgi:hypothetical protein